MRSASVLLALFLTGCSPLWSMSSAPPTTQAELDLSTGRVDVTQGVALAISCRSVWHGGPCEAMTVVSDDPTIARVSFVHLDKYQHPSGFVHDIHHQRSAFLIAGVRAGVTKVRIGGEDADEVLDVHVAAH